MSSYPVSFEVEVERELDAHLRYIAQFREDGSIAYVSYLEKPVELPIYKRSFKTKPSIVMPLIRTSEVGRDNLAKIRELLEREGLSLGLRRSSKRKILNQVSVRVSLDDSSYLLRIRSILATVANGIGQEMPESIVIGYSSHPPMTDLPGKIAFGSKAGALGYKLGKKVGSLLGGR